VHIHIYIKFLSVISRFNDFQCVQKFLGTLKIILNFQNHGLHGNKKSFGNNHKESNCSWVVYEDENLLEMLTCEGILYFDSNPSYFYWNAKLALDGQDFCTVKSRNLNRYKNLFDEKSEIISKKEKFRELEEAANRYLDISGGGIDLIVSRLFPISDKSYFENNDWIAFNGLKAAQKILRDRT